LFGLQVQLTCNQTKLLENLPARYALARYASQSEAGGLKLSNNLSLLKNDLGLRLFEK